jgi:PAS domain S-box-containing protein
MQYIVTLKARLTRAAVRNPERWVTLTLSLLIFVLMGTYGTVLIIEEQRSQKEAVERSGLELARGLSFIGATAVLENLFVVQEALTSRAGRSSEIQRILVLDRDHMVIASDDLNLIGETITDGIFQEADLSGDEFVVADRDAQGKERLVVIHPLRANTELLGWIRVDLSLEDARREAYWMLAKQLLVTLCLMGIAVYLVRKTVGRLTQALGTSEALNRSIVNTALDAVIVIDAAGMITEWNPQAETIFGWSRNDAVGSPLASTIIPAQYREAHMRGMKHYLASGEGSVLNKRIEITALNRDGREFPVELSISPARIGSTVVFNAFVRDISERKQAETSLIQAKDEAERANRAKSDFLSSMSHELRTPMNAILGFAQLLESNPGEPLTDSQQESVKQILKGGYHLLDLINEILDLAKIEAGKITISLESVALGPVIDEVLTLVGPMAELHRIQVHNQTTPHHDRHVQADHLRLKQVLLNLLSNAVKYNREGGYVWVVSQILANGSLQIRVTDTGPGIPQNQLDSLFEPFNRLGADKTEVEGTGIGLTITKRLVELMAGTLSVSSTIGQGSTFSVELPIASGSLIDHAVSIENIPESTQTVLYVEDNPSNLALVKGILSRRASIRLLTAPQAQLGLDLARSHRPDLIILDINLPGMDGYDVLKLLKTFDETRDIPVLALTANATPRDLERGRVAGFARYLIKPLDVPLFLDTVDAFLSARALPEPETASSR